MNWFYSGQKQGHRQRSLRLTTTHFQSLQLCMMFSVSTVSDEGLLIDLKQVLHNPALFSAAAL